VSSAGINTTSGTTTGDDVDCIVGSAAACDEVSIVGSVGGAFTADNDS